MNFFVVNVLVAFGFVSITYGHDRPEVMESAEKNHLIVALINEVEKE